MADKKELLGDTLRESGGRSAVEAEDSGGRRAATDLEPVSWHGNSTDFWKEILHGYLAATCTDCTPQNDNLAVACILLGVKYVAFLNTPAHAELLSPRLEEQIFKLMRDPTCEELYVPVAMSELSFLNPDAPVQRHARQGWWPRKKRAGKGKAGGRGESDGNKGAGGTGAEAGGKSAGQDGSEGKGGSGEGSVSQRKKKGAGKSHGGVEDLASLLQ